MSESRAVASVVRLGGYALVTLWVLIVFAAVADRYALGAGYVVVVGFLLGVLFLFACGVLPEEGAA